MMKLVYSSLFIVSLYGCSTFKTLDTDLPLSERMFIYSGTRLNWAAITQNKPALSRIKVKPPAYPLVDFPFSFALDTLFFPLGVAAVVFE